MKKTNLLLSLAVIVALLLVPCAAQAANTISVFYDVFSERLTVSASFGNCKNEPVSIQVIPTEADIGSFEDIPYALSQTVYCNQKLLNQFGNASFDFPIKQGGEYIIRVHSLTNSEDVVQEKKNTVTFEDAESVWNGLVSSPAENLSKILEILGENDENILSMISDDMFLSKIRSYGDLGDFTRDNASLLIARLKSDCEDIVLMKNLLLQIENVENVSQIRTIITNEKNASVLGVSEYLDRYKNLKNTKSVDSRVAGKKFETAQEFSKEFLDALKAAEREQAEGNKTPQSSPGINNGKGTLGSITNSPAVPNTNNNNIQFTDISDVEWAHEAIMALYSAGIIKGRSNTEFAPRDNITREEFVKIAVEFLGIEPIYADSEFKDVAPSSWYEPYINAALSAGIITGYSEDIFGVGDCITRQDAAVILDRLKSDLPEGQLTFSDTSEASDYAEGAVARLSAAGIVLGSNNMFLPKAYATRAETVCMFYRMMSIIKEENR